MYVVDGEPATWSNHQDLKISLYGSKDRKKDTTVYEYIDTFNECSLKLLISFTELKDEFFHMSSGAL